LNKNQIDFRVSNPKLKIKVVGFDNNKEFEKTSLDVTLNFFGKVTIQEIINKTAQPINTKKFVLSKKKDSFVQKLVLGHYEVEFINSSSKASVEIINQSVVSSEFELDEKDFKFSIDVFNPHKHRVVKFKLK
jgi:hypothetical protein